MYLGLGWLAVVAAPQLVRSLTRPELALLLIGGVLYTVGAIVLASNRPNPWPRIFGFHEVFHACTLVGAGLFAYLVAFVVLPRY